MPVRGCKVQQCIFNCWHGLSDVSLQHNFLLLHQPVVSSHSQGRLEQRLQLEERVMLAEQERQYEQAFDAMLAEQHLRVGPQPNAWLLCAPLPLRSVKQSAMIEQEQQREN